MTPKYETLKFELRNNVAVITLNRPARRNAVDETLALELRELLEHVASAEEARAVVLTGAGDGFCAGADMGQFGQELTPQAVESYLQEKYKPIIDALTSMPRPVIGAINGPAAGAGMAIALACDLRVMSDTAALYPAFSNIGLVPDAGSTYFLVQQLGYCRAYEFLIEGRPLSAERCVALGLANRVVRPDQLMIEATSWARQLAARPTLALGWTKAIAHASSTEPLMAVFDLEAKLQRDAIATEDHQEGVTAFREKRAPAYKGK